jgi:nucleotide-binding universal stress UspA family protein
LSNISRILCPVDFSPGSDKSLQYGIDMARNLGIPIHLVHVYEMPLYNVPTGIATEAGEPGEAYDFGKAVERELQSRLDKLAAQVDAEGLELSARLIQGPIAQSIVEHAQDLGVNLIVMGTHGRTGLDHLLLGSIAERVVRLSSCPVLTVRV